eukprot:764699-Hanusia_phi.AAC.1
MNAVKLKVEKYANPWQQLKFQYGNAKGKVTRTDPPPPSSPDRGPPAGLHGGGGSVHRMYDPSAGVRQVGGAQVRDPALVELQVRLVHQVADPEGAGSSLQAAGEADREGTRERGRKLQAQVGRRRASWGCGEEAEEGLRGCSRRMNFVMIRSAFDRIHPPLSFSTSPFIPCCIFDIIFLSPPPCSFTCCARRAMP